MTAREWLPRVKCTLVKPSKLRSCSAGTVIGPGDGADPGFGCGNAVEQAVWKVTLPSTFCRVWWMWPLRTATDASRFRYERACALSWVPQPHSGYTVHSGMWAKTTTGVLLERPCRSFLSHSSWSLPNEPIPPAFRFITLTRPTKWHPLWSKLYQPLPFDPFAYRSR